MSTHTPGPWTADGWSDISTNRNGNPALVARALQRNRDLPSHPIRADEASANARLIAAAPDLLAVCKRMAAAAGPVPVSPDMRMTAAEVANFVTVYMEMRAAIAKAEGVS